MPRMTVGFTNPTGSEGPIWLGAEVYPGGAFVGGLFERCDGLFVVTHGLKERVLPGIRLNGRPRQEELPGRSSRIALLRRMSFPEQP